VKTADVKAGLDASELPAVTVRFFDEQRNLLETQWLGPFRGTQAWKHHERVFRVPSKAREAIVSIGLFGATGTVSFDKINLKVAD
jgi:protein-L-isoaspartate(D-aspartate) O-methyltransferase